MCVGAAAEKAVAGAGAAKVCTVVDVHGMLEAADDGAKVVCGWAPVDESFGFALGSREGRGPTGTETALGSSVEGVMCSAPCSMRVSRGGGCCGPG